VKENQLEAGLDELRAARRESRTLYWFVGIFSLFANLLMLTGPIFMLQVYDRVLGSRSLETLVALSGLVAFLYGMMGLLDYARGRVMGRVAARFQSRLDRRVFDAVIRRAALRDDEHAKTGLRDLEAVQRLMSSPVLMAVFDLPWTPVFLLGIWIFHPLLGAVALAGGALLVLITLINQATTRKPLAQSLWAGMAADALANQMRNEAEMVQAMGMREAAFSRWHLSRNAALAAQICSSDLCGTFTSVSKAFRLLLQSVILAVGAYLVLQGSVTAGAMIAASILLGRALAPVEQLIGHWALVQGAMRGWHNLAHLLTEIRPEPPRTELPRPEAILQVQGLVVIPPGEGQAVLRGVSFAVQPGQAVGVIGPSGAGKSSLARALAGVWKPVSGTIRLGGAALDQYDHATLGHHVGYLPQRVQLFEGTVAENIARLSESPDDAAVIEAAQKADAHGMIARLPQGYDTPVSVGGGRLSGGQVQRVGLARAMYDDPVMLVLDEPNSNLDNEGSEAVNRAIRSFKAQGKAVLVMAHRPAAIKECDQLLFLHDGAMRAFGPKERVLGEVLANRADVERGAGFGGAA
jgi:PrtD family type I secretion system ABC transporter